MCVFSIKNTPGENAVFFLCDWYIQIHLQKTQAEACVFFLHHHDQNKQTGVTM